MPLQDGLFFQFYYRRGLAFVSQAETLSLSIILVFFPQQLRLRLSRALWAVLGPQEGPVADQKISVLGIDANWFTEHFVLF